MADVQKLNVNNTTYDISTTWSKVTGKPDTFTPETHTHDYLPLSGGTLSSSALSPLTVNSNSADASYIKMYHNNVFKTSYGWYNGAAYIANEATSNAPRLVVTDDGTPQYWTSYSGKDKYTLIHTGNVGSYALTSLPSHTHDDRYYTESEINTKLSGKSDTGHTHTTLGSYFKFNDSDVPEGATNLSNTTEAHTINFYRNGISIPYQMDNSNDGGLIRMRGTTEDNAIFEMATWDDFGGGETIQFNYYPTTSQVTPTYSVSVPKKSGEIALTSDIPTSLPASDVYLWAKAASKPSYTAAEVGAAPASHGHDYLPLSGGALTGPLTCAANGLVVNSGGGDTAVRVLKAYGSGASNSGVYYINFGDNPSTSNCCEICFNYAGSGSSSNYAGLGFYGGTYFKIFANGNSTNPGTMTATAFYQGSDERLKTFYDPIKPDLEKLKKLRKNYFKFNDKDKLEIGVSAQEIQEIYPELVTSDDEGYLSVAYDKLSVIALAALDEQQKEIDDLRDQLKAIKNILTEKGIL